MIPPELAQKANMIRSLMGMDETDRQKCANAPVYQWREGESSFEATFKDKDKAGNLRLQQITEIVMRGSIECRYPYRDNVTN